MIGISPMSLIQHNLNSILNQETTRFLVQQTGIAQPEFIPAVESATAFLLRLIERSDTFNYYELANIFTRNGRESNTPERIISAMQLGNRHDAITDARNLLNIILRDDQENLHALISSKCQISAKQAEQVVFVGAVLVNILLGQLMINHKMNMRAITRNIKAESSDINEKMSADMRELARKLTNGNMLIDEKKPLRDEKKNNSALYAGMFAGFIILLSVIYKACSGSIH